MVKSVSRAWIWFLGIFLITFSILAVGLFVKNRKTTLNNIALRDSLAFYKSEYQKLQNDYSKLESKYNYALRSALTGSKLVDKKTQELVELEKTLQKQDSILRSIQDRVKEALIGYDNSQLSIDQRNGKLYVTMRNKLLFKSGSAKVESQGELALRKLAKVLVRDKDLHIMIEGHTDNVPIKANSKCWKDNWDLSAARAISVARILIDKYHISPDRIEIAGHSQYDPVAPNLTPQGRALNRRIEIIISPDISELFQIIENHRNAD